MIGESNLDQLRKQMKPKLNPGEYVFLSLPEINRISPEDIHCLFHEHEGLTVIMKKEKADRYGLSYEYVAAWITLSVHSSLEAVGLTALFSTELAKHQISCNVIAGYYHDHIFVDIADAQKAVQVLEHLSS